MLRQKNIDDRPPYIEDLIRGGSKPDSEDRLSNIFAATFNHSSVFREIFLKYVELDKKFNFEKLRAETQIPISEKSRLDICIKEGDETVIVIENKIKAKVSKKQLSKYMKNYFVSGAERLVFLRDYYNEQDNKDWRFYRWPSFVYFVAQNLDKAANKQIEKFIIEQFIKHMEELDMYIPQEISKKDFIEFCDTLEWIRKNKKEERSVSNFFSIGQLLENYLSEIANSIKKDKDIMNKIDSKKLNRKFSWWIDINNYNIKLCIYANLKRAIKKSTGIRVIVFGIHIGSKKGKHKILTYTLDNNREYLHEKQFEIKNKKIRLADLEEFALKSWKKFLGIKKR